MTYRELPFPLISDRDHKIADGYGVWKEKSIFGKLGFGVERTSFIIAPDQTIQAVLPKIGPKKHVPKLLELLG